MKTKLLQQLLADRRAKQAVALVTEISSGAQTLVYTDRTLGESLQQSAITLAREALQNDRSSMHNTAAGQLFIQIFNPSLRLIIIGAVHIAQSLVAMARLADYEVIVIDPRQAWTSASRFPDVTVTEQWPDEALEQLAPDHRSAIVTLSHDPKIDDPALHIALRSKAFYIGSLGSKRTHAARFERLSEAGFTEQDVQRIHGPIGLHIGAKSPAEIALSILAEITQTLRQH